MTTQQLQDAMTILAPNTSFSFQLDSTGVLVWIRLEQPGICPTIATINAQVVISQE